MTRAAPPSGSQIAADASRYAGLGYVYGGDASSPGNWDCSSFVSYVLGHDFNLGLPGNGRFGEPGYPPNSHGPVVVDYANWNGARTVAGPPQAGDLCCFVGLGASGHIGIARGPNQMISALDSIDGTKITPIQGYGPYGAPLIYRRLLGVPAGPGIPTPGGPAPGGGLSLAQRVLILGMLGAAVALGLVAVAAVAGTGAAAGGTFAVTRMVGRGRSEA